MPKPRAGFHNLNVQIVLANWEALKADAESRNESYAKVLNAILAKYYRISEKRIPKPKRPGRRPKK